MKAKVLILDHNDSFTWNLVQLIRETGGVEVHVHPSLAAEASLFESFSHIALSPGPMLPHAYPFLQSLAEIDFQGKSVLGICLGHQAIARAFGAHLFNLPEVRHGVQAKIIPRPGADLFHGLEHGFQAGLYHSWAVADHPWPNSLEVTARDEAGVIMALRHITKPIQGIQFHPESFMTRCGARIIQNWLSTIRH